MPLLAPVMTATLSVRALSMTVILSAARHPAGRPGPARITRCLAYHRTVRPLRGVITDWGGVMTNPIIESVDAWLTADGIERASYTTVMRRWVRQAYTDGADVNPIHALERGECSNADFERALARELVRVDGGPVASSGLLERMFAGSRMDERMRELFRDLFDAVVISAEVGMRKPEPRIFLHAARLLGLPPEACIFIDDIQANVAAAEELGFTGVLHAAADGTAERVTELLATALS